MSATPMPAGSEVPAASPAVAPMQPGQPGQASPFGQPTSATVPVAAPMAAIPTPSGGIPMPMTVAPPIPGVPVLPAQSRPGISADPEWFRTAVFYEALLRSFADSDGDGIGDLRGLISRLDYLAWLGVDCVWIPPFYPSPIRDGGYDISDYTAIDPRYGTMEDFRELVHQAHQRGIRIVIDMVVNHTSDAHPWFQASRSDPEGPYGDFYVWADDDSGYDDARIIFVDTEESNWAYDVERGQFYWHRFFSHQPDLNFHNPAVVDAIHDVIRFWARTGVDGFRMDAIPYLTESEGTNCENLPGTHEIIAGIREMLDREFPGTITIAEANQWPDDVVEYFGTEEAPECTMCFHFPVMPRIFYALRQGSAEAIRWVLEKTPDIPAHGQWGTFLRNHDELTLEMVTDAERDQMYAWYAPEERMRANIGIRRRLAPLLDASRAEVELAYALLLSLPGSPCLYYGDEIGMGENIWLEDRDAVRTPMQWDDSPNMGFSTVVDPGALTLPLIQAPGYAHLTVATEMGRPDSLLHFTRRILHLRRSHPVLGRGGFLLRPTSDDAVLAHTRCDDPSAPEGESLLCVANLSATPRSVTIEVPELAGRRTIDLFGGCPFPSIDEHGRLTLTLGARGYYWLSVDRDTPESVENAGGTEHSGDSQSSAPPADTTSTHTAQNRPTERMPDAHRFHLRSQGSTERGVDRAPAAQRRGAVDLAQRHRDPGGPGPVDASAPLVPAQGGRRPGAGLLAHHRLLGTRGGRARPRHSRTAGRQRARWARPERRAAARTGGPGGRRGARLLRHPR
ncbi:maltose alpha-D-glucosyltransferase [Actinomyces johnsonii F0542]|uniref:maltose alpha-D-glucosyltransferase n=1 Tax=Actinomyces johnsonii F0542 TaxID=1321818 RepID=U1QMF8_9ACTO|nr:maltose alpha-D-glucosyltransferase [Actinomyces johnsonii F0542]